jgi:chromosomal replication initiation ATPase DnaA
VLLVGNPGTGKTHLATALGFAACTAGRRVRFTTTTALVTLLLEMRENRLLQRFHKQLERLYFVLKFFSVRFGDDRNPSPSGEGKVKKEG